MEVTFVNPGVDCMERYSAFENSGFFTVVRENTELDTREETLEILARHFGLQEA